MTDAIDAAIAATQAPPHEATRHIELTTELGLKAVLDLPVRLTARDAANLFVLLARTITGEVDRDVQPQRGVVIETPQGPHTVVR
jgi:hypothetical protein